MYKNNISVVNMTHLLSGQNIVLIENHKTITSLEKLSGGVITLEPSRVPGNLLSELRTRLRKSIKNK